MNQTGRNLAFWTTVAALTALAAWLLRPTDLGDRGMRFRPERLTLRPGETTVIELVNDEANLVAMGLEVRFDPAVIEVVDTAPNRPGLTQGRDTLDMGVRRSPGVLEIQGISATGGRVFEPFLPVHRFTVRGRAPGVTALAVERLEVVDRHAAKRSVRGPVARIRVRSE